MFGVGKPGLVFGYILTIQKKLRDNVVGRGGGNGYDIEILLIGHWSNNVDTMVFYGLPHWCKNFDSSFCFYSIVQIVKEKKFSNNNRG